MGTSRCCTRTTSTTGGPEGAGAFDCLQANTSKMKKPTCPNEHRRTYGTATTRIASSRPRTAARLDSAGRGGARSLRVSHGIVCRFGKGACRSSASIARATCRPVDAERREALRCAREAVDGPSANSRSMVGHDIHGRHERHSIPARAQARRGHPVPERTRTPCRSRDGWWP